MHLQRNYSNGVDPFAFPTFHLLRTCNRLMLPTSDVQNYYNIAKENTATEMDITPSTNRSLNGYEAAISPITTSKSPILDVIESIPSNNSMDSLEIERDPADENAASNFLTLTPAEQEPTMLNSAGAAIFRNTVGALPINLSNIGVLPNPVMLSNKSPLPAFEYIAPTNHPLNQAADFPLMELNRIGGVFPAFMHRRQRGEKRPIPDEQKDEKYYERRKRNNEAAKKSRDARKIREDRIAFRAALLEQENSILRAQVMALRDELQTLRQLINTTSPPVLPGRNALNHL